MKVIIFFLFYFILNKKRFTFLRNCKVKATELNVLVLAEHLLDSYFSKPHMSICLYTKVFQLFSAIYIYDFKNIKLFGNLSTANKF